ncbi:exported hypothetical protein [Desulfamplus magnetovallimortis]|uniref:TonB-dependent receptor plug domain-containing protein n=1 Tax=Desulfamplus magnetovallimortis TaxID=1246637 RepID=A0A1W1HIT0_9BACT|nr:TonB-dependent receptor [Desulfamplus magnetovallimortis]SLM32384.1 exported hypothetical protein [Desulfamplus magnetovallimortis]
MKIKVRKKIFPQFLFLLMLAFLGFQLSFTFDSPLNAAQAQESLPASSSQDAFPSEYDSQKLFEMSLQELMTTRIQTGTITGIAAAKAPVARTVITENDIAMTPARSILDLIEVYVPGATFINHYNGPRFGFRGVLGDQNYHYLLLVNGKNLNLKIQDGPLVEIFNRDLNDIREIEIIRGPGSVTYGSGAIGGVINIITRTAENENGRRTGIEANTAYRYFTTYASQGYEGEDLKCYLYGSYSSSSGESSTRWFYVDRAHGYGYGFMSETWGNKGLGSDEPSYLADFLDTPQAKLHLDLNFFNGWHLWGRYSSYSWEKLAEKTSYADGEKSQGFMTQSALLELDKTHNISKKLSLESRIGFDSISLREIAGYQGTSQPQEYITQFNNSYSENELNTNLTLHYDHSDKFRFALGAIYAHEYWLPEWGKDDDSFILSMRSPIRFAVLTEDSEFYQKYGEGTSTVMPHLKSNSYSILSEANMNFYPGFHMILSGRADKNDYTDWYYSPRVALISSLTDSDILRAVWQRSVRIPNFPEIYTMDYNGQPPPEPETLVNYEVMYEHYFGEISFNSNIYYNILDEVSWTDAGADVVGNLKLFGIETGLTLKDKRNSCGINYSWVHQMDYDPYITIDTDLTNPDGDPMPLSENYADNRINNLPSHTIKMFWQHSISQSLKSHMDARFYWGQNQIDMLDMFRDAHNQYGTDESREEMNAIYDTMTDHGYGKPSFTMDMALSWKIPVKSNAELTIYAMNLVSWNHIRYGIQFHEEPSRQYPRQATFIEEPVSLGIKMELRF